MGIAALGRGDAGQAARAFEDTLRLLRQLKDKVGTLRRHRDELLREAGNEYLARRLRKVLPKGASRIGSALIGRVRLRFTRKKEMAEC